MVEHRHEKRSQKVLLCLQQQRKITSLSSSPAPAAAAAAASDSDSFPSLPTASGGGRGGERREGERNWRRLPEWSGRGRRSPHRQGEKRIPVIEGR